jgi:hypothetical protein
MLPIGQHFVFGAILVKLTSLLRLIYGRAQGGCFRVGCGCSRHNRPLSRIGHAPFDLA